MAILWSNHSYKVHFDSANLFLVLKLSVFLTQTEMQSSNFESPFHRFITYEWSSLFATYLSAISRSEKSVTLYLQPLIMSFYIGIITMLLYQDSTFNDNKNSCSSWTSFITAHLWMLLPQIAVQGSRQTFSSPGGRTPISVWK